MPDGYLIRNGTLYDGMGGPPQTADIRLRGRSIAEIGPQLPLGGEEVLDAEGILVVPGLIDLHAHVFTGMGQFCVDPAVAGLATGVTTILDTGSAGALTYPAFHRLVMAHADEEIYALLHISRIGALQNHTLPPHTADLTDPRYVHVPSALECIEKYRDRILGTKVRLTAAVADHRVETERAAFYGAVEAAEKTGLRCMVHHVASNIPLDEVLTHLRPGDIYTHMYHPQSDGGFARNKGAPDACLLRARERGIVCDVGHGVGSFAWSVAEPACQQHGFWPDTISTDLHQYNVQGPVFDLPTTMSKFLHLGMSLERVIQASTQAPARAMGMPGRLGVLRPGHRADVALLRLESGVFPLTDVLGEVRLASRKLSAVGAFKDGRRHVPAKHPAGREVPLPVA